MGLFDKVGDAFDKVSGFVTKHADIIGLGAGIGEKVFDNYSAAEAASKSFDQQKWMAENAYQAKVRDLRAAGLNPMLAVSGPGASFPSAPVARTDFGGASAGALRRSQAQNVQADTENKEKIGRQIEATIENIEAGTGKTNAETENVKKTLGLIHEQIFEVQSRAGLLAMETKIATLTHSEKEKLLEYAVRLGQAQTYIAEHSEKEAKAMAEMWSTGFGELLPYMKAIRGLLGR